jgi:thiosulfate/3-mercaptopyruvate sulfurtransferase
MANSPLKNTEWLVKNLGREGLVVLDASWHLPDSGRNAREEYRAAHIPGAHFFDIDTIVAPGSEQPHTLPDAKTFAFAVREFGITNGSKIIIYDNSDFRTAARAWWMFRTFGHRNVYVLNGGLQKWMDDGKEMEGRAERVERTVYYADYKPELHLTKEDLLANLESGERQIIDARAKGRYEGTAPEPREGLRSGHIPGALNLPFGELYKADGTMLEQNLLAEKVADAGIDLSKPTGTSCGSGVTACCLALAFAKLGHWNTAIYDGSWSEWGADPELPIES